jgi:hypothetical protein
MALAPPTLPSSVLFAPAMSHCIDGSCHSSAGLPCHFPTASSLLVTPSTRMTLPLIKQHAFLAIRTHVFLTHPKVRRRLPLQCQCQLQLRQLPRNPPRRQRLRHSHHRRHCRRQPPPLLQLKPQILPSLLYTTSRKRPTQRLQQPAQFQRLIPAHRRVVSPLIMKAIGSF